MSCSNMGNERLFPNEFSATELVLTQKQFSYLKNISMGLLNWIAPACIIHFMIFTFFGNLGD